MIALVAIASLIAFILALYFLGVIRTGVKAITTVRGEMSILHDRDMDDRQREKAMQQASLKLFAMFFSITLRFIICMALAVLPVWASDAMGLASMQSVIDFLSRIDVIIVTTFIFIAAYLIKARVWPSK